MYFIYLGNIAGQHYCLDFFEHKNKMHFSYRELKPKDLYDGKAKYAGPLEDMELILKKFYRYRNRFKKKSGWNSGYQNEFHPIIHRASIWIKANKRYFKDAK